MPVYKTIIPMVATIALSGCSTIYFDQTPEPLHDYPDMTEWHHNLFFATYEISEPVNLQAACQGNDWGYVKTELTFLNALSQGLAGLFGPIWYPKTVEVRCLQQSPAITEQQYQEQREEHQSKPPAVEVVRQPADTDSITAPQPEPQVSAQTSDPNEESKPASTTGKQVTSETEETAEPQVEVIRAPETRRPNPHRQNQNDSDLVACEEEYADLFFECQ